MLDVIKNNKGENIDYTFHYGSLKNRYLLIVVHGLTGDKDHSLVTEISENVAKEGMSVLRFSFSGNGESEGRFEDSTISKGIDDLQAILNTATEQGWRSIYAGYDIGSTIGVLTATIDSRIQLLISLAGIVNTHTFSQSEFGGFSANTGYMWNDPKFPLSLEFVNDMQQIESLLPRASSVDIPWLLVHGKIDNIVPVTDVHSLLFNFENSRELIEIDDADHQFSGDAINTLSESVINWLGRKLQIN